MKKVPKTPRDGWWNAIWRNKMIETTVMKFGQEPHGMIDTTLKEKALGSWALSFHTTTQLEQGFLNFKKRQAFTFNITQKRTESLKNK